MDREADQGAITALRRANFLSSPAFGMVTVIVSGSVPFSTMSTPAEEPALSAPMMKTSGQEPSVVPASTVSVK
jgi:hypothetical protein